MAGASAQHTLAQTVTHLRKRLWGARSNFPKGGGLALGWRAPAGRSALGLAITRGDPKTSSHPRSQRSPSAWVPKARPRPRPQARRWVRDNVCDCVVGRCWAGSIHRMESGRRMMLRQRVWKSVWSSCCLSLPLSPSALFVVSLLYLSGGVVSLFVCVCVCVCMCVLCASSCHRPPAYRLASRGGGARPGAGDGASAWAEA